MMTTSNTFKGFSQEYIDANYIDKQKVKEAIENFHLHNRADDGHIDMRDIKRLLKKLEIDR